MGEVNICPKNQTEVDVAGKKLGCGQDKYGHSQYMCIPNEEKTALVEFCYNGVMGIEFKGSCLEASEGKVISKNCSSFAFGCPDEHVYKYEFFKYPACQYIDVQHRCYKLDPLCPPEQKWNNTDWNNTDDILTGISIFLGCMAIIIIIIVLWKMRRDQKNG
uniref:Uncharacterized protein LOC111100061 n=1 Tax=Crassostrea virginica TaxID=6565 RepID=A0A8B8A7D6_CRAVI|nr:uncharacterized protein LOC111100061 [Crassostrea virginica]